MIIIVAGPSGVGKTTLARKLSKRFQLPVIHKDDIKEILFDTLGYDGLEKSNELGKASWEIFYHFAEEQISNGINLILEANFKPKFAEKIFINLQKKYEMKIIQIRCIADIDTVVNRFRKREDIDRHPGHQGHLLSDEALKKGITEEYLPLEIDSSVIEVDMNNFELVNHEELFAKIEELK